MKTYYIITIGCQMNKSDSERVAGYLEKMGYKKGVSEKKADVVVVTTCGVRQSAEDRVYGLVPKIKKENRRAKIVLTGCLSRREDVRRRLKKYVDVWLPINEISNFSARGGSAFGGKFQISNKIQNPKKVKKFKCSYKNYLSIIPKYSSEFSAFVPIGNGCDNFCSYCVVPYARGREEYRPAEEIVGEARNLAERGYKEIILIAQNVNSYVSKPEIRPRPTLFCEIKASGNPKQIQNSKNHTNFAQLLRMVNNIEGDFWIRFATSHPKDMSDELIQAIAECEKVCRHIHLPAQAGDNIVLSRMNRKYTIEHYKKLITKIREKIKNQKSSPPLAAANAGQAGPRLQNQTEVAGKIKNIFWIPPVAITTDIIVGFPSETKRQFNNTAKLFREAKFDMAYIARYSPRPGTAAAKMDDNVPSEEKKRREDGLMKILRRTALTNNKKYIGQTIEVLVEREKGGAYFGKTETNKMVKIGFKNKDLRFKNIGVGEFVAVKITVAHDFGLEGEMVSPDVTVWVPTHASG